MNNVGLKRGAFIVVEGVDRSGKTTQCKQLVNSLQKQGIKAKFMNFPDRSTHIGGVISQYLQDQNFHLNDKTIHLLFSANRWELSDKIKEQINQGYTLIVDRYSYSGVAYSVAKKGMDVEWCMQPEVGLPKPDLVLLLTLSENEMLNRGDFGKERYENTTVQKSVKETFMKFAQKEDNWKVFNAAGTIDEVQSKLLKTVLQRIKEVETSPVKTLSFAKGYKSD